MNLTKLFTRVTSLNPETQGEIIIHARDFTSGNFNYRRHDFGRGLIIDGGNKSGSASYHFSVEEDGQYELWSRYASGTLRPVDCYMDATLIKKDALSAVSGGWTMEFLRWYKEITLEMKKGKHILEIRSSRPIPHIEKFLIFKKENIPNCLKEDMKKDEASSYLNTIKQYIDRNGLIKTAAKVLRYLKLKNLRDRYLEILGIYDREYAYKGPFHVQIDLTNRCNNTCIACWCNSPLLKEEKLTPAQKKEYLPLGLVKELLDEVTAAGATEIYYSGSGEPFVHPQIMEILRYTKKKNLSCHVNTNFTLLDKEKLDCLIDIGVDFLTVSTWAGTAETYVKTHPHRTKEDFYRIRDNLLYLNTHKEEKPRIKLYNVLFNMNYNEVEKMVGFAFETVSESLEFTLIDTIPNATDVLALNKHQLSELKQALGRIRSTLDKHNRVKDSNLLLFQFDQFLRRIYVVDDVKEAKYDRNIIDSMPCYIGWLFARIVPNGDLHSCLKSHRIPTGSLYSNRFLEIWNSSKQRQFRKKTLIYKKDDIFFRSIGNDYNIREAGCYKSCDDIGRNTWMHSRIKNLSVFEKLVLKGIAAGLKIARRWKPEKRDYKENVQDPVIRGILHGRKAFVGPEQVVIDPTNRCNLSCISCWLYAPSLINSKGPCELLKKELSKEVLIRLIDDLSALGTKRVRFTGGGEPFMHKNLMEILEYASKKKMLLALTTNFGLVSKEDINRLLDLGLEELCISIWASDVKTYREVHPGCPSGYFEKVEDNLEYLKGIRSGKPRVTFSNVIMNLNFRDFKNMYEFGKRHGADAIYFTLVDIMKGLTDRFLLTEKERMELLESALELRENNKRDGIQLEFFDGFLRRISKCREDFEKGEYDKTDVDRIPCYAGWIFSRVSADGSVAPCCRGVKKIMGDINKSSFKDIWHSSRYNEFRTRAKYLPKDHDYFAGIGCTRECDNLMHNIEMHKRLNAI